LDISESSLGEIKSLPRLSQLEELNASKIELVSIDTIETLFPKLTMLNLPNNLLDTPALKSICLLTDLLELNVANNPLCKDE
jgi:hypothetical protein